MTDRSLPADARAHAARAAGQPQPDLRLLLAAKLAEVEQWEQRYDAETMTTAGIFHTYYRRWQGTIAEARRQKARADKATARGDIWKAKAVAIEQDRDALLNQPALRLCVYPHCLRQFDLSGRPTRPEWSSEGWLQVRAVDGYVCPDHAAAVRVHTPHWLATGKFLACSCGWESPAVRWRGYGAEAWKDHLLTETEPS